VPRPLGIAVLTLLAFRAAAIPPPPPADLSVTASFDRTPIETGSRAALRFTIANAGPYAGYRMEAMVKTTGAHLLPASGSSWACVPEAGGTASCTIDHSLQAGAAVTIEIPVLGQSGEAIAAEVFANHTGSSADPNLTNNRAAVSAALTPSMKQIDLAVDVDDDASQVLPFGAHTRTIVVGNEGPRVARDVVVYVTESPAFKVASRSADWVCTEGTVIACTYARSLGAGREAELVLEVRPPFTGRYGATVTVAGSGGEESDAHDNTGSLQESFGVASDFEPVLVPYLAWNAAGVNGSRWSNELVAEATRPGVPLHGAPCAGRIELRDTTTLWPNATCPSQPNGALLYVPRADRDTVVLSSQLFEHGTLAAQLPVVDGSRFQSEIRLPRLSLSRFGFARLALRVYAIEAGPDQWVLVDTWPRYFQFPPLPNPPLQKALTRVSEERNELGLPIHPASVEFGQQELMQLLGPWRDPVTLVVSSQHPIWAMVVIVDNATQRPVFLTPQ
jgi:hypothetical protein